MNRVPTLDSRMNIEEPNSAVVPNHLECTPPLHRLGEARRQEDMSRRNVARHLGITMDEVRQQECNTTDLPISLCCRRHVVLFYSIMVARILRHDRVWCVNVGESRGVG
jgi:hypothetical protein